MLKKPKLWISYLLYSFFPCILGLLLSNFDILYLLPGLVTAIFAHALSRSRLQNVYLSIGITALMGYLHAFLLVGLVFGFDDLGVLPGFSIGEEVGLVHGISALLVSTVLTYWHAYYQHTSTARFRH